MKSGSPAIPSFGDVYHARFALRNNPSYTGGINQGTSIPGLSLSPYSLKNMWRYTKGLAAGDVASKNRSNLIIGKNAGDEMTGVLKGSLNLSGSEEKEETSARIIFAGDLMVSESGKSIQLGKTFLDEIAAADALVINIESPLNFEEKEEGRSGLSFAMSKSYLANFVKQIKNKNPNIQLVYNIANNHALDGSDEFNPLSTHEKRMKAFEKKPSLTEAESKDYAEEKQRYTELKKLLQKDPDNFILLRTIKVIQEIDANAKIIGAHVNEQRYESAQLSLISVLNINGLKIGLLGLTDILNNNSKYWDKRVVRTEDITPEQLKKMKKEMGLNYLYLFAHGNLEQSIHPLPEWRNLATRFLNDSSVDGFIGHGPHVPQTNEVLKIGDKQKLLVHSLGNLFGPKKLDNTGLNLLAVLDFHPQHIDFEMKPIEAYLCEGTPCLQMVTHNRTHYPDLLKRIVELYPINSSINLQMLGKAVTDSEKVRVLTLDGTEGAVACRVRGSLIADPTPKISAGLTVETSYRSRARMENLIAVRGEPNQGMIGPGDYYGNWEMPHKYTYTIELERGLPTIYQHPLQDQIPNTGRTITLDEMSVVNTRWVSGDNKQEIDEKRSDYQNTLTGDSLFKRSGILEMDVEDNITLKRINAREVDLTPFKANLVANDKPFIISSEVLPSNDEWRAVSYQFDPAYAQRQITLGGGLFLETHNFAQSMTPLDEDTDGFIILGKWEDPVKKDRLQLIGFQIPLGHTLIVGKDCIHGDTTLAGMYMMCMTSNHLTMSSADTVFLKNKNTKHNMQIDIEGGIHTHSLDTSQIAPKPLCYYKKFEPIDTFEMRTKGYDAMFNPLSNAWIKVNTPQFLREVFYKQPLNAKTQQEIVAQKNVSNVGLKK